ncbi:MAG: hypothetical protein ACFNQI_07495, partial [Eikenella corrodens]
MTDHSSQSLDTVVFRCAACKHTFECAPQTVLDAPEYEWHPFAYQAACPKRHKKEAFHHLTSLKKAHTSLVEG